MCSCPYSTHRSQRRRGNLRSIAADSRSLTVGSTARVRPRSDDLLVGVPARNRTISVGQSRPRLLAEHSHARPDVVAHSAAPHWIAWPWSNPLTVNIRSLFPTL